MTAREWKPGDLAVATVRGVPNVRVMAGYGTAEPRLRWVTTDARLVDSDDEGWWFSFQATDVRPLIVLDLIEHFGDLNLGLAADFLAAAAEVMVQSGGETREVHFLRWLVERFDKALPPKPAEPTGLGAVVEDAEGHKFVRVADPIDGWAHGRQWQRIGGEINAVRNFGWPQLNAVRVLSEGVTA